MQEVAQSQMEYVEAGVLTFGIEYRGPEDDDEGVSIHVFGEVDGKSTELLRFDCFNKEPHYHYGPEGKDERLMLDYTAEGDPVPWAIDRLRFRLIPMLARAGHAETARQVDQRLLEERLDQVEGWATAISRNRGKYN